MKVKALPMAIALAIASLSTQSYASTPYEDVMAQPPELQQALIKMKLESDDHQIQALREYKDAIQARDEIMERRDRNVLIEIEIQRQHETRLISGVVRNTTAFSGRSVDEHEYVSSQLFVDGKLKNETKDKVSYGEIFDVTPVITDDGKILVRVSLSHSAPVNPAEPTGPAVKSGEMVVSAPEWTTRSLIQDLKLESGVTTTLYSDKADKVDSKGVLITIKATIK